MNDIFTLKVNTERLDGTGREDMVVEVRLSEVALVQVDGVRYVGCRCCGEITFRSGSKFSGDALEDDWCALRRAVQRWGG